MQLNKGSGGFILFQKSPSGSEKRGSGIPMPQWLGHFCIKEILKLQGIIGRDFLVPRQEVNRGGPHLGLPKGAAIISPPT